MAFKGDTIRLMVKFKDLYDKEVEAEDVYLNIYDNQDIAIASIPLNSKYRLGIGEYFYDWTIPYGVDDYITYEFTGTHRGMPILARERISIRFSWYYG